MTRTPVIFIALLALSGCGAETAGTAAVGAAAEVEQAKNAQQMKEDVQQRLDAAMQQEQQRLPQQAETQTQH